MPHSYWVAIIHNISTDCGGATLLHSGIISHYQESLSASLCKYITFCMEIKQPPMVVCEDTLQLSHIWPSKSYPPQWYKHMYLSTVQYSHIITSESTTLRFPRLKYILKGIHRHVTNYQPREWQLITFPIIVLSHCVIKIHTDNYKDIMILVACSLTYYEHLKTYWIHHTIPCCDCFDFLLPLYYQM